MLQKYFDFISDDIARAAFVLMGGGDMATVGSCGIYSGGLMALSARFSPNSKPPSDKEMEVYYKALGKFGEFSDWFTAEFGSVTCKDVQLKLHGRFFNFMNDEEVTAFMQLVKEDGVKCSQAIASAALKVAEILSRDDTG